ncbi:hypothetical protein [Flammeovirga pacifica]|uniref:hypothetical protein n=1 Tax=Flammeovirga pacifica TaxID=915059 RepID=UPI001114958C|nr:hypothetical protein [Flammeovirga pacifica]
MGNKDTNKTDGYRPISCTTYDHYEIWAMRKTLLSITYNATTVITRIVTLTVTNGVEYAILENGEKIRLDNIDEVLEA